MTNGLYTGKAWRPLSDGGWVLSRYHKGQKEGPERVFEPQPGKNHYYMASVEWYNNGEHPVKTSLYPSGAVERYAILDRYDLVLKEDGSLDRLSERGSTDRSIQTMPMAKGKLNGRAVWYRGGNGMGTQWFYAVFKNNKIVHWELCEAIASDVTPLVSQYTASAGDANIE